MVRGNSLAFAGIHEYSQYSAAIYHKHTLNNVNCLDAFRILYFISLLDTVSRKRYHSL